jgi:hypothetical protein
MKQSELRAELEARQEAIDAKLEALGAGLTAEQLAWSPPAGGWGVGQVFEHLTLAAESYVAPFTEIVAQATPGATAAAGAHRAESDTEWRPAFFGGLLYRSLAKEGNRLPAPKRYKAGPLPRPGVVAAFLATERRMAGFRTRCADLDWRRTRLISPALPLPLIRYNLGDAFRILVVHAERHARQIERILARPELPK